MLLSHGPRSDAFKRSLLTFLLCLLTFSFGTFMGKAFTENQTKIADVASCANHDSAFAATQPANTDEKQMLRVKEATTSAEDSVTSAYYDDPVVQNQIQNVDQAGKTVAVAPAPVVTTQDTVAAAPMHKHAKRAPASIKKAAPEKKTATKIEPSASAAFPSVPMDESEAPESLLGKYTIQIASVVDEAEAAERVNEFKQKGLQAFYVANDVPGMGKRYRVSLGVFGDANSARDYRHHLDDQNALPSDVIIKKITLPSKESR